MYQLKLFGVPALIDENSRPLNLGAKLIGLLAILALSNGKPRPRSVLQDLLWSDRGEFHGRSSLRQSLTKLRGLLGDDFDSLIETDGGPIRMKTERLSIDAFDRSIPADQKRAEHFLEGLDIRDNSFECWLRDTRQKIADGSLIEEPLILIPSAPRRLSISLCLATSGEAPDLHPLSNYLTDRLVVALTDTGFFDVSDNRDQLCPQGTCDLSLVVRTHRQDGCEQVTITARRRLDNVMLWGRSASLGRATPELTLRCVVSETVEHLCQTILRPGFPASVAGRMAMDGLEHMFRRSGDSLAKSESLLKQAIECEPKGIYIAWYAYLSAFRLENTKGKDIAELREHSNALARRALELDPWNPVGRSLVAHVYGFILRDFAKAASVMEPVMKQTVDSAIFHHNAAMLNFYINRYDQAKNHASLACAMGHGHPFRYAFSTSMSMISLMTGELENAVSAGELALGDSTQGRETYGPTLRYLAAAYASKGNRDAAEQVVSRLGEPGVSRFLHALEDPGYPVPSAAARLQLRNSLKELTLS